MSTRNSQVEPYKIQEIFSHSTTPLPRPSPVEHVSIPASPVTSPDASDRQSFHGHGRAISTQAQTTGPAARMNRFSMNFPVQLSASTSPTRINHSPTRELVPITGEASSAPHGPTDTTFLTAIAAQERRVLELKDEVTRAEAELNKLKKQWTQHEAQKKRNEIKKVAKLQPLQTSLPTSSEEKNLDGTDIWIQQEMARRKALLSSTKPSTRTVFSGSRHTRTLSLLSPVGKAAQTSDNIQTTRSRPPRKDSLSGNAERARTNPAPNPSTVPRVATAPDLTIDGASTIYPEDINIDTDLLIKSGKKVATDLRDGLWTFFGDLRQVTVGEEATQIPPPLRARQSTQALRAPKTDHSRTTLRSPTQESTSTKKGAPEAKRPSPTRKRKESSTISMASAPALADPSFWIVHKALQDQAAKPAPVKRSGWSPRHSKSTSKVSSIASNEIGAWDTWDETSPHASRSSSSNSEPTTSASTVSGATSPRISCDVPAGSAVLNKKTPDSNGKDAIPWPALANLGPKALRRTASHLMSEWEKSLTPSPGKEYSGQEDYLGLNAEAAAAAAAAAVSTVRKS